MDDYYAEEYHELLGRIRSAHSARLRFNQAAQEVRTGIRPYIGPPITGTPPIIAMERAQRSYATNRRLALGYMAQLRLTSEVLPEPEGSWYRWMINHKEKLQ